MDIISQAARLSPFFTTVDKPFLNAYGERVATQAEVDASYREYQSDQAYDEARLQELDRCGS